jgi:ectoine hydroxylase-related dioxygenase (phytanoyl-CoA dioxygenase family)
MPNILTPEQIAFYERDGYLFPFDAFSAETAAELYQTLLDFEEEIGQDPLNVLRIKAHLVAPFVSEIARTPGILDVVEDLMGPDIKLYLSALWAKKANDPKFVSWHQDSTYFGLDPHEEVTVWVALTPSTAESGCVRVLPGSHRQPDMQHVETRDPLNLLSRGQAIMGIHEADAVNMELQPGQFSVHHERMVHGSPPNGSALPRIGVSFMFIPCHVKSTIGRKGATMLRGEDRFGNWDEDPLPRFNQDPVSVQVLKKFQNEYRDPNLLSEAERAAGAGE